MVTLCEPCYDAPQVTRMDTQGRCPHHPFVQLQRQSPSSGRWVALLDCCPVCESEDEDSIAGTIYSESAESFATQQWYPHVMPSPPPKSQLHSQSKPQSQLHSSQTMTAMTTTSSDDASSSCDALDGAESFATTQHAQHRPHHSSQLELVPPDALAERLVQFGNALRANSSGSSAAAVESWMTANSSNASSRASTSHASTSIASSNSSFDDGGGSSNSWASTSTTSSYYDGGTNNSNSSCTTSTTTTSSSLNVSSTSNMSMNSSSTTSLLSRKSAQVRFASDNHNTAAVRKPPPCDSSSVLAICDSVNANNNFSSSDSSMGGGSGGQTSSLSSRQSQLALIDLEGSQVERRSTQKQMERQNHRALTTFSDIAKQETTSSNNKKTPGPPPRRPPPLTMGGNGRALTTIQEDSHRLESSRSLSMDENDESQHDTPSSLTLFSESSKSGSGRDAARGSDTPSRPQEEKNDSNDDDEQDLVTTIQQQYTPIRKKRVTIHEDFQEKQQVDAKDVSNSRYRSKSPSASEENQRKQEHLTETNNVGYLEKQLLRDSRSSQARSTTPTTKTKSRFRSKERRTRTKTKKKQQRSSSQTHGSHHADNIGGSKDDNDNNQRSRSCSHVPSHDNEEAVSSSLGKMRNYMRIQRQKKVKRLDENADLSLLVDFPHGYNDNDNDNDNDNYGYDNNNGNKSMANNNNITRRQNPPSSLSNHDDNINCDSRGRCIHHPQNRLKKKRIFGGWKVLMTACPDCCVMELKRLRPSATNNENKGNDDNDNAFAEKENTKNKPGAGDNVARFILPQRVPSQRRGSSNASASTANSTANSSLRSSGNSFSINLVRQDTSPAHKNGGTTTTSRSSSCPAAEDNPQAVVLDSKRSSLSPRCVKETPNTTNANAKDKETHCFLPLDKKSDKSKSKKTLIQVLDMAWTDINGTGGKYSGTVNRDFFPHGNGVMVYDNGMRVEGVWKKGKWKRQATPDDEDVKHDKGEKRHVVVDDAAINADEVYEEGGLQSRSNSMPARRDSSTSKSRSRSKAPSSRKNKDRASWDSRMSKNEADTPGLNPLSVSPIRKIRSNDGTRKEDRINGDSSGHKTMRRVHSIGSAMETSNYSSNNGKASGIQEKDHPQRSKSVTVTPYSIGEEASGASRRRSTSRSRRGSQTSSRTRDKKKGDRTSVNRSGSRTSSQPRDTKKGNHVSRSRSGSRSHSQTQEKKNMPH